MNILILEDAAEDIISIFNWYESKRHGLGDDFELCLDDVISRISSTPEIYPEWYRQTRCALMTRFPYGVFYKICETGIVIIGVFHLKRKPSSIKLGIKIRKI
jgi:plasmid stabilization system protein ParE